MSETTEHADKNVEIWKVKKLIKSLEAARGNGTSMISLIIPPGAPWSYATSETPEYSRTDSFRYCNLSTIYICRDLYSIDG